MRGDAMPPAKIIRFGGMRFYETAIDRMKRARAADSR